jgi:acetolactate synthase-1/2/3 large subunit
MNLVTGIADAGMDSVPVLAITGQVPSGVIATDAFQESDVVGVMLPIAKQTYMPLTVDTLEETIHEASTWPPRGGADRWWWTSPRTSNSRKPDRPIGSIPAPIRPTCRGFYYSPKPDRERLRQAVGMINRSERPIILCGHGVIAGRASAALRTFAERAHIPVAFTLHGLSALPMDHSAEPRDGRDARHGGGQPGPVECRSDSLLRDAFR